MTTRPMAGVALHFRGRLRFARAFLAALLFAIPNAIAHAAPVSSTAWVRAGADGVGTGWVVDRDRRWLITCLHVVGERERIEAFFPDCRDGKLVPERDHYIQNQQALHEQGKAVRGKVILRRETADLALIELDDLPKQTEALPLTSRVPRPGEAVWSIGHRHDAEALWVRSDGAIRQAAKLTDGYFWRGKKLAVGAPALLVQSPINTGDSGAAIIDDTGKVVGVMSAVRWQAAGTAVAIQSSEVAALLADARKEKPPKPSPDAEREYLYDRLARTTVWVRPNATNGRAAGWVLDRKRGLILTSYAVAEGAELIDVVLPRFDNGRLIIAEAFFRDLLGLRLSGDLVRGVVLARDMQRDLTLIECGPLPAHVGELKLAEKALAPGAAIHVVNHPTGVEWLWLHASGSVRQSARIDLGLNPNKKVVFESPRVLLLQLPGQGGAGGAVANEQGEIVGMLTSKEASQQMLAYAISAAEIRAFVDAHRPLWSPGVAAEHRKRGLHLLARQVLPEALGSLTEAGAHGDLANAWLRLGRRDKALVAAQAAVRLEPTDAKAHCRLGEVLLADDRKANAIESLTLALKCDPKHAEAHALLGETYRRMEKPEAALKYFNDALWHDANCIAAYEHRARLHEDAGKLEDALADYARAAELDPMRIESVRRRAAILYGMKEWKKTAAECERLLEIAPTDVDAYIRLGRAWLAFGDEAKALPAYVSAARIKKAGLQQFAADALAHGDSLATRFPDDAARQLNWLRRVVESLGIVGIDRVGEKARTELAAAAVAPDDAKRVVRLRAFLRTLATSETP